MTQTESPDYVQALEAVYGPPIQEGFGSAIFSSQMTQGENLEDLRPAILLGIRG
jgi:hypothetical protein